MASPDPASPFAPLPKAARLRLIASTVLLVAGWIVVAAALLAVLDRMFGLMDDPIVELMDSDTPG